LLLIGGVWFFGFSIVSDVFSDIVMILDLGRGLVFVIFLVEIW